MIRPANENDFETIYEIINNASIAYKGFIPEDLWREPYMSKIELEEQINDGVNFYCFCEEDQITGVMGIQDKGEVNLIRHAYVRAGKRNKGVGSELLKFLTENLNTPVLIGTWKAAIWAISFYSKHGYIMVPEAKKNSLLRQYWKISERQIESSVVLADIDYSI